MKTYIRAAVVAALFISTAAFAAETAPETVAQAQSEATKVVWGWGAAASQAAQFVAYLVGLGLAYALRQLPANLVAILSNMRVELLLQNAINYGVNAVDGAVKGKTLQVNVGNEVLAKALQYAVDNSSTWLQSWAGGPEGLAKKIWGRLNLDDKASDAVIPAVVAGVAKA